MDAGLKIELRKIALARRDALGADVRAAAAQAIAARPFPMPVPPGSIVSGFMPLKSEINPLPLMRTLADAGAKLALPVVAGQGKPLTEARQVFPDILLVPLLAFDRSGQRIGYGAGYYDMTITALRARKAVVAVGIAFAAQEVAQVPSTPRDARLDLVLTEREVIDVRAE
jgi:5-formyltetrahydrofolate cyclo-ligase